MKRTDIPVPLSSLTDQDIRSLADRWIPPELADQAGLYRVDSFDGARLVGRNGSGNYSGLAIPNIRPGRSEAREYRLRRDCPDLEAGPDGTREKGKYLSPPGRGNLLYFTPGEDPQHLTDPELPVAVVEGEFKALALARLAKHGAELQRWLSVAIPGCWCWRGVVGKDIGPDGDRRDVKGPIPDLDRIAWGGRLVYLVPDVNAATSPSVGAAWRELGKELAGRGGDVVSVELPGVNGVNGVDDLLATWGPEKVLGLFADAKPRDGGRDYHLTDLGNARRFADQHRGKALWVTTWNQWAIWDGHRFRRDDTLEADRLATQTVMSIYADVAKVQDTDQRKRLAGHAAASESLTKIRAMLALAKPELAVTAECFDQDPDLLNCLNGTVHLPTGELRPHSQADRITKLVRYNYRPDSECPVFLRFLREIMADRADLTEYLQAALGYSGTGRTSEKSVIVCHGVGDNGKTTLLNCFRNLIEEYAVVIQITSIMSKSDSVNAQADLADLMGARFAMTSETDQEQQLSEGRLKRITQGMGKIRAVRKYENPFTFSETHTLWMDCNHRPNVKDDGKAIWSRLHLIPFDVTIPKADQDPELPKKLEAESEGILAWAVQGAMRWYREGLRKPWEVEAATENWRKDSDILEAFFTDRCNRGVNRQALKTALYVAYKQWAEASGLRYHSKIIFGRKLSERGFDEYNDGKQRYWLNLELISDDSYR